MLVFRLYNISFCIRLFNYGRHTTTIQDNSKEIFTLWVKYMKRNITFHFNSLLLCQKFPPGNRQRRSSQSTAVRISWLVHLSFWTDCGCKLKPFQTAWNLSSLPRPEPPSETNFADDSSLAFREDMGANYNSTKLCQTSEMFSWMQICICFLYNRLNQNFNA